MSPLLPVTSPTDASLARPGFIIRFEGLEVRPPGHTDPLFRTDRHTLFPGRIYALTGSSGSGKTTLLRALMGFLRVDTGWRISGDLLVKPGLKIGWITQNPSLLLFHNFVHEEFNAGPDTATVPLLEELGLSPFLHRRCAELSQGERAMVALARALHRNVRLLLLDEIATHFSSNRRDWLKGVLKRFAGSGGCVIMAEHSREMLSLADELLLLEDRRLSSGGHPEDDFSVLSVEKNAVPPTEPILRCLDLRDGRIPSTQRSPLSAAVRRGEIVGIRGDNGSGKSTLLQIIAGIHPPENGTILWDGRRWKNLADRRGVVSYLPQNPIRLFFQETVREELLFGAPSHVPANWLDKMNLRHAQDRSLFSLCGGEQQRLGLAVCLQNTPELLLLDEPTYGMDSATLRLFCGLLKEHRSSGATTLVASHDQSLLAAFADHIIDL
ncbi:MAG TPA: ATP-binding cassette domain-containing protein [Elusimicrobiota bacterium]|nr:ATP-binding cassette domain-containing protein [Elusimicrobiota bacterium]